MRCVKINAIILSILVSAATIRDADGQIPEGWEIVEITNHPNFYDGPPDINDRGQVVFHRAVYPDWSTGEIMLFDRGALIQITNDDVYDAFPRINNHGDIVWVRKIHGEDGPAAIVMWRDQQMVVLSDQPFSESDVDINDAGQVVWKGYVNGDLDPPQLFLHDGGVITQITDDGLWNQQPRINQRRQVVWTRYDFTVSPWTSEIMLWDDETITQLSNGQGQMQSPDLNDLTQVVWASSQAGVELWDDGVTTQILESGAGPSINDPGHAGVTRWDEPNSNTALWLLRDGSVLQLTDGSFGGGASEINRRGEMAFNWGFFPAPNIALFTKPMFSADVDFDADVDLRDVAIFQECFGEEAPFSVHCLPADIDNDGEVDVQDLAGLVEFMTGPG